MKNFRESIAKFLVKAGISANFLTFLGLFFAFLSAAFIYFGAFFVAGTLLLLSGFCDLFDGAVARASGKASVWGGILDSTLDRYGDGFVLSALALRAAYGHEMLWAGLAVAALLGSFAISYVRARAECEMDSCRIGFWERGERLVFLSLGLLFNHVHTALLILALGTQWTASQRLLFSRSGAGRVSLRTSPAYRWKVAALLAAVLFLRF